MKLAIMQPYFFPYIGYFQLINAVDTFVIYDDVQYIQRGWINRNNILSKDGKIMFTIPVQNNKLETLISSIRVSQQGKWKESLAKSIYLTYKKAPNFEIVFNIFQDSINTPSDLLVDYCTSSINLVLKYLNIEKNIYKSSEIEYEEGNKVDKINSIINKTKAQSLILPPGSVDLYKKEDFTISSFFLIPSKDISYQQFSISRFEANLSIIDVLMFNSIDETKRLLNLYTLK